MDKPAGLISKLMNEKASQPSTKKKRRKKKRREIQITCPTPTCTWKKCSRKVGCERWLMATDGHIKLVIPQ